MRLKQSTYALFVLMHMSFSVLAADFVDSIKTKGLLPDHIIAASCMPEFTQLDLASYTMNDLSKINDMGNVFDAMQSWSISVHCDAPIMLFVRHKDLVPVAYIWTEQGTQLPGIFRVLNSDINFHILENGQAIDLTVPLSMEGLTTLELVYF